MFTGIIEEIGIIKDISKTNQSMKITVEAKKITTDLHLGDSIAINGTCLTVTAFNSKSFCVDIMPETFNTTSLKTCQIGARVNLERALLVGGRVGGHFVTGHIDGTGYINQISPQDNAIYYTITLNNLELLQYCIYHGSIAIDGTSLTIFDVTTNSITVSIIPHTIANSIIGDKKMGDIVNIECDMLAKFVQNSLKYTEKQKNNTTSIINHDFLQQNGFI